MGWWYSFGREDQQENCRYPFWSTSLKKKIPYQTFALPLPIGNSTLDGLWEMWKLRTSLSWPYRVAFKLALCPFLINYDPRHALKFFILSQSNQSIVLYYFLLKDMDVHCTVKNPGLVMKSGLMKSLLKWLDPCHWLYLNFSP